MVRLLCSEIWVFAFVGWRYVPSPPVLSRVNNNVMLIICHTVQHKIDFYLWNFKSTIRRMCLFMFWCWACHKTESTDLPFEYDHVCHGVSGLLGNQNWQYRVVCLVIQTVDTEWSVWSSKLPIQSGLFGHPNCLYRVVCLVIQTDHTEWSLWSYKVSIQSGLWANPNWVYRVVCEAIQTDHTE